MKVSVFLSIARRGQAAAKKRVGRSPLAGPVVAIFLPLLLIEFVLSGGYYVAHCGFATTGPAWEGLKTNWVLTLLVDVVMIGSGVLIIWREQRESQRESQR